MGINDKRIEDYMKRTLITLLIILGLAISNDQLSINSAMAADVTVVNSAPDVGKVKQIDVNAKGVGMTSGAAVNEALKSAIQQVNGISVDTSSRNYTFNAQLDASADIQTPVGKLPYGIDSSIQSKAFAEQIITNSKGLISSFKIINVTAPTKKGDPYTVEINAKIAKFEAPADAGKIKVVVTPLRSIKQTFNIGGREVAAAEILGPVRNQIIDALAQSGRYIVLDRQSDGDIQNEIEMITSGQTSNQDMAKLSQAFSADIIWSGVVNSLTYDKSVRKSQLSDRELVSYSGSWSISHRLINLTTRHVMQSGTLTGEFPRIGLTALSSSFNESKTLKDAQENISRTAVNAIMMRTFPVSVVEINGDTVIFNQGEGSVKENSRYKIYALGKEMKDPQTGQSLGNVESECCEVVITRVASKLSYGILSNVKIKLNSIKPGVLQIREQLTTPALAAASSSSGTTSQSPRAAPREDDKDW